jgi:hypothetical protein
MGTMLRGRLMMRAGSHSRLADDVAVLAVTIGGESGST